MEHITSRHNPLMGHIRRLVGSAAYRRATGEFLCDSPKLLQEALLWKAELVCVVHSGAAELPPLPVQPERLPLLLLLFCGLLPPLLLQSAASACQHYY